MNAESTMSRCSSESVARAAAEREGKHYGFSILDGQWYVGTIEQLAAIGVRGAR